LHYGVLVLLVTLLKLDWQLFGCLPHHWCCKLSATVASCWQVYASPILFTTLGRHCRRRGRRLHRLAL